MNKNKTKNIINILIFSILLAAPAAGENLSITQMDTSDLFLKSQIDCYVRVTEGSGNQLDIKNFSSVISVLQKDEKETELEITDIKRNSDNNEGITFMLIIDNSGSMYEKAEGSKNSRIHDAVKSSRKFFRKSLS